MENNKSLKVLVYGATGSQATPVVMELLRKGHQPIAVTHSPQKAALFQKAGAETVVADLANADRLTQISQGVDAVSLLIPFFLPNPLDGITYAKHAIDAAKKANSKLIVWNASGVIPSHRTGNLAIDIRMDIARYLRESGMPFVIFQPSLYAENLLGPWTAPFVKHQNRVAYPVPSEIGIGWIPARDVATLIVAAFEHPQVAGNTFLVSGQKCLTGSELAHTFSQALNREITYYALSPKEFGAILDSTYGEGAGQKAAQEYQKMWDTGQFPPTHFNMDTVLDKLPVQLTPLSDWVKQQAEFFSHAQSLPENAVIT